MTELTAAHFADFFQAVHSKPDQPRRAFEWQKRLAKQVLGGNGWPDVIRVPTSCGKTSVLDIALFELAMQASREPSQQLAARRICFVIDRKLVVDEVSDHARSLYDAILSATLGKRGEPALKSVAQALASLAVDKHEPLRVVRLRGAVYRDDGWAADPLTPTILISTVDQIGSRLLFRGYGVSRRSRPVQAGLLAFDTRIILDEAHLSTVFAETLNRIRQYQQWAKQSPLPSNRLVSVVRMSATAGEGEHVFELTGDERRDEGLMPRLEVSKPAELISVPVESIAKDVREKQRRKARALENENREKLVTKLVEKAKEFAGPTVSRAGDNPRVIGVVVNRVATARRVFEGVRQHGENQPERQAVLLTGRIRPYDRDRLLREWLPKIRAGREASPNHTLFVVATQTVEVGANVDFDALVTEASPLDALRQRFGRLHRIPDKPAGRGAAMAAILIRSDKAKNSEDDLIYGESVAETWKWLNAENKKGSRKRKSKRQLVMVDFGINHLDPELPKTPEALHPLLASRPDAPLLFPAHLDAWVQTNPMPDPDPDVGPFLHGASADTADVQLIWRADLAEKDRKAWPGIVRLMPPRIREALPVPLHELRAWLGDSENWPGDVTDIEGTKAPLEGGRRARIRHVLRWRGAKRVRVVAASHVRPGDVVIVPASRGGADRFGWNPESQQPVADIAESCLAQLIDSYPEKAFRRPRLRFRLHPSLVLRFKDGPVIEERFNLMLRSAVNIAKADDADPRAAVRRVLETARQQLTDGAEGAAIDALLQSRRPRITVYPDHKGVVITADVRVEMHGLDRIPIEDAEYEDPEGDEASLTSTRTSAAPGRGGMLLTAHTKSVKDRVEQFASRCGIVELKNALALAAEWHDQGKRDFRFQSWLQGSELKALAALANDGPLAKSGRELDQWGRSGEFGYPRGMRHEFVSVRLFDAAHGSRKHSECHDLARLLIGTHHGFGRAFAPAVNDRKPVDVTYNGGGLAVTVSSDHRLYRLDCGWVEQFWRMVGRYGWWGLAYLESLLISADHLASAIDQPATGSVPEEPAA